MNTAKFKLRSATILAAAAVAGLTTFVADSLNKAADGVNSFSDKLRAKGLRKAAAAFDKMAALNKDKAVDCLALASALRVEGNGLFGEAEDMVRFARFIRAEADDLDPPAPAAPNEPL